MAIKWHVLAGAPIIINPFLVLLLRFLSSLNLPLSLAWLSDSTFIILHFGIFA